MAGAEVAVEHVQVLGSVQAISATGTAIELPSASQRRLLALLALRTPNAVRAEWLADVMDVSPGALRKLVGRLRSVLGPDVVRTTSTGYRLDAEVDAYRCCRRLAEAAGDPDRLAALEATLDEWAGPALDEFRGESWADGEAARLTEIHAAACDDYGAALLAHGRAAEAVAWLEGRVAAHPLRDRTRGLLIRALAGSGRRAEALRAFQVYRSYVAEEVGTDPSPELLEIERRVATGWDGIEPDGAPSRGAPAIAEPSFAVPTAAALAREVGFVGRIAELGQLAAEYDASRHDGLRWIVVTGEPGIGKTSLFGEFARTVAEPAGAVVVYGRCDDAPVPLQPFRSVVGTCVDAAPVDVLRAHVARCGGELLRLAPQLGLRVEAPAPTDTDHATERFLVFEAVTDLLRRLSELVPLVVVLDDLHWAEPTALQLLRHLARAGSPTPLLVVVGCRESGEHHPEELRLALADLDRAGSHRLALGGFDDDELTALLAARRGPEPRAEAETQQIVDLLRDETAGHPLYVSQLIQHWNDRGGGAASRPSVSPTLRDLVWSRVTGLGDSAADVLTAAAVLGTDFDEAVLLDIVDVAEPTVADTLDAATRGGLLSRTAATPRSARFVHTLVANALYADLGGSRRARLHERAARALTKSRDEVPQSTAVALARHCALGGLHAEAQHWSTVAGDDAFDHLAAAEAVQHYRSALALAEARGRPAAERADLLVRLGTAQDRTGDGGAFATLLAAAELARGAGAHDVLIRAALATDRGFQRYGATAPEQHEIVEAAVTVADPDDRATYARLLALLAQSLIYAGQTERRVALAREALAIAERASDRSLLPRIAPAVVNALAGPERSSLRAEIAERAVAEAGASRDPVDEFAVYHVAYVAAIERADPDTAARSLARMRTIAAPVGTRLTWVVGMLDTFQATMEGRFDEAEALATATFESGQQVLETDAFTIFVGQFFAIGSFAGRHAELMPLVEQALADDTGVLPIRLAYGIICAEVGRHDTAEAILAEGVATGFAQIPTDQMLTTSLIGYAVLALELGDVDAAAALLPRLEPYAAEVSFTGMTSQGPIAAYVGKLESLLGRHDLAEEHLRAALAITERFGWSYHRATTLFALAEARQRRLGSLDAEGRAWLDEASARCRTGGFAIWVPRTEALARAQPGAGRPTA